MKIARVRQRFPTYTAEMYPKLGTAKLSQVDDTYYYGCSCRNCRRSKRLSLVRLRSLLGDDFPLVELRSRLKCSTCGSREIVISFFTPDHSGSMAERFAEPAI